MQHSELLSLLQDLGLNNKEAKVYYAALSLGPSSALQISRSSKVKRTTVYSIFESLIQKGLLRRDLVGLKEKIVAEPPEKLVRILDENKRRLSEALPELSGLYSLKAQESVIKHYRGRENLKSVYKTMISSVKMGEDYMVMTDNVRWEKFVGKSFSQNFKNKRGRLNIQVRMILKDTPLARARKTTEREPNEQVRLLPDNHIFSTNLVIIPTKVFIHQFDEPTSGMLIENPHIVHMHREMFELIWTSLTGK